MSNKSDLSNKKFTRLLAVRDSGKRTTTKKVLWECLCDCGTTLLVVAGHLLNGNTKSCGCLQKEEARKRLLKHGKSGTPEYNKNLSLRKYNLTTDSLNLLYIKQKHKCAICGDKESDLKWTLNIDHNHKTGKVRGLLCATCNVGLGNFKDDVERLKKAIIYLQNTQD